MSFAQFHILPYILIIAEGLRSPSIDLVDLRRCSWEAELVVGIVAEHQEVGQAQHIVEVLRHKVRLQLVNRHAQTTLFFAQLT